MEDRTIFITEILKKQSEFFALGKTLDLDFRLAQLKKIKSLIESNQQTIIDALYQDLKKPKIEATLSEIMFVIDEINFMIGNLKKWMKPNKVSTPFLLWPGKSSIHYEPYGSVLIIGPWNYPFLLIMSPLIGAIAAGNCAVIKPSDVSTHTEACILNLINKNFSPDYITAIQADGEKTHLLLQEKYDYIFYTGGPSVGKIVMAAAAKHLTPVTLELGGKNPCIIDESANIDFAARRIIWGKMMNAGQTCIAPDYLLVHSSCKDHLINKMKLVLNQFYSTEPESSESYCRIINAKHFNRLKQLMDGSEIIVGGQCNEETLFISPTILDNVTWESPIMNEEIFGPLLPIITYEDLDETIKQIKQRPKPLSLYIFTENTLHESKVMRDVSFGGGCVNDCILHIANVKLPFGGVGQSGIGAYHGKYSFETFSHKKSIYKKSILLDFNLQYPPYTSSKYKWIRRLLKWRG